MNKSISKKCDANDVFKAGGKNLLAQQIISQITNEIKPQIEETTVQGFHLKNDGLYADVFNKDSAETVKIGNRLEVIGNTTLEGINTLLIEYMDCYGNLKHLALPRGELSEPRTAIKFLLNKGYVINELRYKNKIADYLNKCKPTNKVIATKQVGWHQDSYVFPDRVIGDQNIKYFGSLDSEHFKPAGTIQEWIENIANTCAGNHFLELGLYAGFSSILLPKMDFNYGLHFYGKSSGGKSTLLRVISSIFANPKFSINKWNSTHVGLEMTAHNSNHSVMLLDEIHEVDRNSLDSIYMLVDGTGRTRGKARFGDISTAKLAKWQTVIISSGETSIKGMAKQLGKTLQAGEVVRFVDIEVGNVCDNMAQSEQLTQAAHSYYGSAAEAFIRFIVETKPNIKALYKQSFEKLVNGKDLTGQCMRVAKYFALMITAGELAVEAKILPDTYKPFAQCQAEFDKFAINNNYDIEFKMGYDRLYTAINDPIQFVQNIMNTRLTPHYIGWYEVGYNDKIDYYMPTTNRDKLNLSKHIVKHLEKEEILIKKDPDGKNLRKTARFESENKQMYVYFIQRSILESRISEDDR